MKDAIEGLEAEEGIEEEGIEGEEFCCFVDESAEEGGGQDICLLVVQQHRKSRKENFLMGPGSAASTTG